MKRHFAKLTIRLSALALLPFIASSIVSAQTKGNVKLHMLQMNAGITVTGTVGVAYEVQSITNLGYTNAWRSVGSFTLPANPHLFIDTNAAAHPGSYYRVLIVPPTNMVVIPEGEFLMGDTMNDGSSDELPTHTVNITGFFIDKSEVTQGLWDGVFTWATNHGYNFDNAGSGRSNQPVEEVSWYDAAKWCNARSEMEARPPAYYIDLAQTLVYRTGRVDVANENVKWRQGYRLPTEAEWEKAARGGTAGTRFPWGDTITQSQGNYWSWPTKPAYDLNPTDGYVAAYSTNGYPYTSPAGAFQANGFGLYDVSGNVWEWCWDRYGAYSSANQTDPQGPSTGSRILRGGGWGYRASNARLAERWQNSPDYRDMYIGFRTVLPIGP